MATRAWMITSSSMRTETTAVMTRKLMWMRFDFSTLGSRVLSGMTSMHGLGGKWWVYGVGRSTGCMHMIGHD